MAACGTRKLVGWWTLFYRRKIGDIFENPRAAIGCIFGWSRVAFA
jgi:hypothetical protein